MSSNQYLEPIWDVVSPRYLRDESTAEYRWVEQRALNDGSDQNIKIILDDNSSYLLMSEAHVEVNFTVSRSGATPMTTEDGVCIPNAFAMFDSMKLFLNNQNVQTVSQPGVVHHMVYSHLYSKDYAKTVADTQMFYPLTKRDVLPQGATNALSVITTSAVTGLNAVAYGVTGNGQVIWGPTADPTAEYQYAFLTSAYSAPTFTATLIQYPTSTVKTVIRRNPLYDPVLAQARKRIVDGMTMSANNALRTGSSTCSVWLPLREIFGILNGAFNRVNRGSKIEIQLDKTTNMARCFYALTDLTDLTFTVNKCSLWIPRLQPELESAAKIEAQIASTKQLVEPYEKLEIFPVTGQTNYSTENRIRLTTQTNRVLRLYVGLQLDTQQTSFALNPLQFEGCNVEYVEARINNVKFPMETYAVNNTTGGRQGLIRMLRDSRAVANKSFDYDSGSCIDYEGFANGCQRIYVLDMTQMANEAFKRQGVSDLEVRVKLSATPGGSYSVYTILVSEGELKTDMLNGSMKVSQW